jgi:hypothetical protein
MDREFGGGVRERAFLRFIGGRRRGRARGMPGYYRSGKWGKCIWSTDGEGDRLISAGRGKKYW